MTFFKELLELEVLNTVFVFNGRYYEQTEGLGMGLPLGPTFANIFMSYHEVNWLKNCPATFKPELYKRYVDDTFLLFRSPEHPKQFLDYLNNQHPNIKFTMELEEQNKLSFLDLNVEKSCNAFHTSVYRKSTFTGLGLSFFSNCNFRFKVNGISTLLNRAYNLSSDYKLLHFEFEFLRKFFSSNGYPAKLIDAQIRKFMDKMHSPKTVTADKNEKVMYFSLPYFGHQSEKMKIELSKYLSKIHPSITFRFILVNPFKIGSFFNHKDRIPTCLRSSVVYEFRCACDDAPSYVGSTSRHFFVRMAEHKGISSRTGKPLTSPPYSSIRNHAHTCKSPISDSCFRILKSTMNPLDLLLLESLCIHRFTPKLNETQSAVPLLIVK